MIRCRCPECSVFFRAKANQFGREVTCAACSHAWELDTDDITRYALPKTVTVRVEAADGSRIPEKRVSVEYNHPLLSVTTDQHGTAVVTDEMIHKGWSDFVQMDGIMDHRYDDPSCQRYLHLSVGPRRESIDFSGGEEEIEVTIVVDDGDNRPLLDRVSRLVQTVQSWLRRCR